MSITTAIRVGRIHQAETANEQADNLLHIIEQLQERGIHAAMRGDSEIICNLEDKGTISDFLLANDISHI